MRRYHNLISFLIGVGFFLTLQNLSIFRYLLPAFLIFTLLVSWYNKWYLRQIQKYNFWVIVRPFLLLWSGFGIFFTVPSAGMRSLFLAVSILLIIFFELMIGNFAENLLINETLIISLGLFITFSAFNQYFLKIENFNLVFFQIKSLSLQPFYIIGLILSSFLLARSFYEFIPKPNKTKILASLIIALFCVELFWSLSFLPFHYPVLGLILFNIFYFCLIISYYHFFQTLNFKKIQFHLMFIILTSSSVALTTPWKILE